MICDFVFFQLAKDLLHPSLEEEKRTCKLKRLVQSPNSYFMDVKCPGNFLLLQIHFMWSVKLSIGWLTTHNATPRNSFSYQQKITLI